MLPLDDRFAERANPDIAGRPQLIKGTRQLLFGGMGRLTESSIVNYKNKSHAVTAEVVVPQSGAEGVIVAVGGIIGGWSLYAKGGKPKYHYNFYGVDRYTVEGTSQIPPGTHQVRMEFKYDGGGLAKGGTVTLFVDGKKAGEGRVDQTEPMVFSADETCDVGYQSWFTLSTRLWSDGQPLQRRGELGRDRHRQGLRESRPPDFARRTPARRHGAPIRRTQ